MAQQVDDDDDDDDIAKQEIDTGEAYHQPQHATRNPGSHERRSLIGCLHAGPGMHLDVSEDVPPATRKTQHFKSMPPATLSSFGPPPSNGAMSCSVAS